MGDEDDIVDVQPHFGEDAAQSTVVLMPQSLADLERIDELSPLSPQVMSRQATINIGTIGHVAHGKTTVVKAISGKKTTKFKQEEKLNITIHLGYANAKIFKSDGPAPACYRSMGSATPDVFRDEATGEEFRLVRHVSFVDCPGHDILMATMLNGAAIMDAAFLLVAANETFPQPQTLEHLKAVEIMQLTCIIVLQNKIDLVKEPKAKEQYDAIRNHLKKSSVRSPIVPISAQLGYNIDYVLEYLCHVPVPPRHLRADLRMVIVRSFDVNKPGAEISTLSGGVAGGSVIRGVLKLGQEIEIRPGRVDRTTNAAGQTVFVCRPLLCKVVSLKAEQNPLEYAIPGGLIGVGTNIDPTLTRQNKLVGHVIGDPGKLPGVYVDVEIEYSLLPQVVGAKAATGAPTGRTKIALSVNDALQVNVGSFTVGGTVVAVQETPPIARVLLQTPICAEIKEMVAISRRFDRAWRLIGWGKIVKGVPVDIVEDA